MPKSEQSANLELEYFLRSGPYTTNHVQLFSDIAAATPVAIARQPSPVWSVPAGGIIYSLSEVNFEAPLVEVTIQSWAVMTALTGGFILYWDRTRDAAGSPIPKTASPGDPPYFPASKLQITVKITLV